MKTLIGLGILLVLLFFALTILQQAAPDSP